MQHVDLCLTGTVHNDMPMPARLSSHDEIAQISSAGDRMASRMQIGQARDVSFQVLEVQLGVDAAVLLGIPTPDAVEFFNGRRRNNNR